MFAVRLAILSVLITTLGAASAWTDHACDALGDEGWSTVLTHETVNVVEGAPYQSPEGWFIDRTTTVLPLCNYINAAGNYSLLSYSLSPEQKTERIAICKQTREGSAPVAPYAGPCPPR
jgi:hypothetical protein